LWASAVAESDDAGSLASTRDVIVSGGYVEQLCVRDELAVELEGLLHVVACVTQFKVLFEPIEKRRRDGDEAILRVGVRHGANRWIDAKNLLDDDQSSQRLTFRPGYICA
jgi:hypothetical protein